MKGTALRATQPNQSETGTRCSHCRTEGSFAALPEASCRIRQGRWLLAGLVALYVPIPVALLVGFGVAPWLRIVFGVMVIVAGVLITQLPRVTRSWFARVRFCRTCGLAVVLDEPASERSLGAAVGQLTLFGQSVLTTGRKPKPDRTTPERSESLLEHCAQTGLAERVRAAVRHVFRMR